MRAVCDEKGTRGAHVASTGLLVAHGCNVGAVEVATAWSARALDTCSQVRRTGCGRDMRLKNYTVLYVVGFPASVTLFSS